MLANRRGLGPESASMAARDKGRTLVGSAEGQDLQVDFLAHTKDGCVRRGRLLGGEDRARFGDEE
eukprot:5561835-Prorocentrum_lima.AAC.1